MRARGAHAAVAADDAADAAVDAEAAAAAAPSCRRVRPAIRSCVEVRDAAALSHEGCRLSSLSPSSTYRLPVARTA